MSQSHVADGHEFGRDLCLVSEMVITGRRPDVGAKPAFYAALAHNKAIFRHTLRSVQAFQEASERNERNLREAIHKGIERNGNEFLFFDPGLTYNDLLNLSCVEGKIVGYESRLESVPWAEQSRTPCLQRMHITRWNRRNSYDKDRLCKETIASLGLIMTFLVMKMIAEGRGSVCFPERVPAIICKELAKDNHYVITIANGLFRIVPEEHFAHDMDDFLLVTAVDALM